MLTLMESGRKKVGVGGREENVPSYDLPRTDRQEEGEVGVVQAHGSNLPHLEGLLLSLV